LSCLIQLVRFSKILSAVRITLAVVVELAAVDPDRIRNSLTAAEHQWEAFDLLRRG